MKNPPLDATLAIGALARLSGASVRAIRHYDAQGLLDARRADNGYRIFTGAAVTRVKQVQRLVAAGFTLAEIRGFPHCMLDIDSAAMCAEAVPNRERLLAALEVEMAHLEERRARLHALRVDVPGLDGAASMTDAERR